MGRTRRKRRRKTQHNETSNDVTNLLKWMSSNNWENCCKLKLSNFDDTGRGLCSTKRIHKDDLLISVPFKLLISIVTMSETSDFMDFFKNDVELSIQEMLAVFLVYEEHKKEKSFWKHYISSLPQELPPLPWISDVTSFPENLRIICAKRKEEFDHSWCLVKESISRRCPCCDCSVLDYDSFLRAYVLVNTRAVYLDPAVLPSCKARDFLRGDPSMALCPLLDMFNHSAEAKTTINYTDPDGLFYRLITGNSYKKRNQIFISYGSHNNEKLFLEYGFFVPKNRNDVVEISIKEVVGIFRLNLTNFQYKFIKNHEYDQDFYVSVDGLSYKLKGFLFVGFLPTIKNYNVIVFNELYPENFLNQTNEFIASILEFKVKQYLNDFERVKNKLGEFTISSQFFLNRLRFIKCLQNMLINT